MALGTSLMGVITDNYDDPNFDSTTIIIEDESPHPEVQSAVANIDEPTMPVSTLRAWVLGVIWAVLILDQWPLVISTQLIGLSVVGICKHFLIDPPSMIWPENIVSTALSNTIHSLETSGTQGLSGILCSCFFAYVFIGHFFYSQFSSPDLVACFQDLKFPLDFLPSYLFTALSSFLNTSIIWGVIGPQRIFSHSQLYYGLLFFFLIGAVLPIIQWALHKTFKIGLLRYLNFPVIFASNKLLYATCNPNQLCALGSRLLLIQLQLNLS
ncbi:hypothetical protein EI94DRAFT_1707431 [Lactarius quietus]|nr:hypothetical protein EI94DRAFT_1707431 [Lactarius quietus]